MIKYAKLASMLFFFTLILNLFSSRAEEKSSEKDCTKQFNLMAEQFRIQGGIYTLECGKYQALEAEAISSHEESEGSSDSLRGIREKLAESCQKADYFEKLWKSATRGESITCDELDDILQRNTDLELPSAGQQEEESLKEFNAETEDSQVNIKSDYNNAKNRVCGDFPTKVDQLRRSFVIVNKQDLNKDGIPEVYVVSSQDPAIDSSRFLDVDADGTLDFLELANNNFCYINITDKWQLLEGSAKRNDIPTAGTKFRIRAVAGGELGAGPTFGIATFQIEDKGSGERIMITFTGIGLGVGLKGGSGSGLGTWCEFETSEPMKLSDFESFGRITSAGGSMGAGAGYAALSFYPITAPWIYVQCQGLVTGLGLGASTLGGWWEIRD